MNWKLIFQLSLFGLFMAIATVYFIPSSLEPFFWLIIFIICAYLIARNCTGKYFLHGLLVSLVNCIWITAIHAILYHTYIMNHPKEDAMMQSWPKPWSIHPRVMMLVFGPLFGVVSGLVLGLFAFVASRIWKSKVAGS
jgi:hypothetical protein